ncbi:MAG: hypothetical protein KF723_05250 [Rhizobiaceae bacterium]|nr:hypothetical protein [Rhizobiaceae bacterium]
MSTETAVETGSETGGETPKKKRSIVKLAIFALVPVLLAGGGYAGWTMFLAAPAEQHAAEAAASEVEGGEHGAEGAPDEMHVSAVDYTIAAETSFSYALALSEMLTEMCGTVDTAALEVEAGKEAHADGMLVHHSWAAAYRRMGTITDRSCSMMLAEIMNADGRAYARQAEAVKADKKASGGGGHH